MNFSSSVVVSVPAEFAFKQISNVEALELTLPPSASLHSENGAREITLGSKWILEAKRGGRNFKVQTEITKMESPSLLTFYSQTTRMKINTIVEISAQAPEECLINYSLELAPVGILGRILVSSIKASRQRIDARLASANLRIKEYLEGTYT